MEESLKNVDVLIATSQRHFKKGGFVTMSKSIADLIIKQTENAIYDCELTGFDLKLFFVLLKFVEQDNKIKRFKQKELAEMLGTSRPNVTLSLKKLSKYGIIQHVDDDYYFNDQYIYTGKKRY
jgi:DNA-binding MarR family transcriptional regulator